MEILTATPIGTLVAATSPGPCLSCFFLFFLQGNYNKILRVFLILRKSKAQNKPEGYK
jgi:hypothetical protein